MNSIEILTSPDIVNFIRENESADIQKLLLNPPAEFKQQITFIADQILSRRKAKSKLPNWHDNYDLIMPPPLSLEQCSSPTTGAYKASIFSGNTLVDLTGGMGIDTLYLSDQFQKTHHVEMNEQIYETFQHNLKVLSKPDITAHHSTAEEFISEVESNTSFFIDPARRSEQMSRVFLFEDCSPNVIELLPSFRVKADKVLIKAAPMIDISLAVSQLEQVKEVHIVSVKNEVKEVLFLLDYQTEATDEPIIKCVNLETSQPSISFCTSNEKTASSSFSEPQRYLYDPNSSILKAGAFKLIGTQYKLHKIAINTHLYTSESLIDNFPGRVFEIIHSDINKKNIGKAISDGKVNVLTKNYPQKPDELKKKLKLKDGGKFFLIGLRDKNNKPKLLLTKHPDK